MLKLIKNIHVYSPEDMGVKDVLIAANKICRIYDEIKIESNIEIEVIDGSDKLLFPGFIDSHVHILGGGGEGGGALAVRADGVDGGAGRRRRSPAARW